MQATFESDSNRRFGDIGIRFIQLSMESLILAQDERWRRA